MTEEYIKDLLDLVDDESEEVVIALLAMVAKKKGIDTYITKKEPIKMQVFNLDENKYGRVVDILGRFKFIKTIGL